MLSPCNLCFRDTVHDLLISVDQTEEIPDGSANVRKQIWLQCRGCLETTIKRVEIYHSGDPDPDNGPPPERTVGYIPPRLWHRAPPWLCELVGLDDDLHGLLCEIYSACHEEQTRLLCMGVRTALDHIMVKVLGGDRGGFSTKLKDMISQGHFTKNQGEAIDVIIDAGSASSHRAFKPPVELLRVMVTALEGVIHHHYFASPMLRTAKTTIPPRP